MRHLLIPVALLLAGAGYGTLAQQPSAAATNIRSDSTQSDLTADQQVMHALNRLTFGPKPGDAARVRAMGLSKWIDLQLHPERIPDPAGDQIAQDFPALQQSEQQLASALAEYQRDRQMLRQARADSTDMSRAAAADTQALRDILRERVQLTQQLNASRVARAVASDRQLLEVMTDFWENHFNIYAQKGLPQPYYLVEFDRTIRAHALGKFRDLIGAVAHSPAMLFYLDNATSRANPGQPTLPPANARGGRAAQRLRQAAASGDTRTVDEMLARTRMSDEAKERILQQVEKNKQSPPGLNENYGRELLELHTLGVDGGYTQQDVINVARALTGWTIRPPNAGGGYIFRPEWHDAAQKVVLGHTFPTGRGEEDGEQVLDIIAKHPATARFIATKLARRFVSDTPPAALVDRAAQTFLRTDGDIREVVRTIVTSQEFLSRAAFRSKVKSPFEVVVSTARALSAEPDATPRTSLLVAYLGQPIYGHQAPDGWPEHSDAWMNTGAILNRINFGMAVAANRLPGASFASLPWADSVKNATKERQVDAVVTHLLGGAVSPDTRKVLLSGTNPLAANAETNAAAQSGMQDAMRTGTGDDMRAQARPPRGAAGRGERVQNALIGPPQNLKGLAQIVGLAIGSPEFQRR